MKIDRSWIVKKKIQPQMLSITTLNSLLLTSFINEEMVICFQAVICVFLVFEKFSCGRHIGIVENCGKMRCKAAHLAKKNLYWFTLSVTVICLLFLRKQARSRGRGRGARAPPPRNFQIWIKARYKSGILLTYMDICQWKLYFASIVNHSKIYWWLFVGDLLSGRHAWEKSQK